MSTSRRITRAMPVVAALLLLAEAALRWGAGLGDPPLARLDPVTEYELIGPATYTRWGNEIMINSAGMRGPHVDPDPGPNDRRVLLIGDSVIYGGHFIDQQETIAARMTQRLAQAPPLLQCDTRVLPLAVSSWGPVNQAAFLGRMGTFGADVAVIMVSSHDLYDVPNGGVEMLPYRLSAPKTAIGDAVQIMIERVVPVTPAAPEIPIAQRTQASLQAMADMASQLRSDGIKPYIYFHPTIPERGGNTGEERSIFQQWAADNAVDFVDLGDTPLTQAAYRDDIHPNAVGAAQIADTIVRRLMPNIPDCS